MSNDPKGPIGVTGSAKGWANLRPYKPGQSGNPTGRNHNLVGLVRELTDDGRTLISLFVEIATDPKAARRDRIEAGKVLLDRGFGKAVDVQVSANVDVGAVAPDSVVAGHLEALAHILVTPGAITAALPAQAVSSAVDDAIFEPIPPQSQAKVLPVAVTDPYSSEGRARQVPEITGDERGGGGSGGRSPLEISEAGAGTLTNQNHSGLSSENSGAQGPVPEPISPQHSEEKPTQRVVLARVTKGTFTKIKKKRIRNRTKKKQPVTSEPATTDTGEKKE